MALIHTPPSGILCGMIARPLTVHRLLLLPLCLAIALCASNCSKDVSQEKVLNVYIWSEYLPRSVLEDFKAKTGITVHVALYDSNETLLEKLQSGITDYDIVVPSDYMVHRLIAPDLFNRIAEYEREFGKTIHRGKSVVDLAERGTPYPECNNPELVGLAMGRAYPAHLGLTDNWSLPPGAFKHCGGPN